MPKQKTHKGTIKVLNVRDSGSITIGCAGGRHKTGKNNAASKRKNRAGKNLDATDLSRLKHII